jgi:hypothetical protein
MIAAGVRGHETAAGGDPCQIGLAKLGEEEGGDLVRVRAEGLRARTFVAAIELGRGEAVMDQIRQAPCQ